MSVFLITEQSGGRWHAMSWEALAAAQQLASELGASVTAVVVGKGASEAAAELAAKNVERVLAVEHDLLADYTADGYTAALEQALDGRGAKVVVLPNTYQVRDYAPKLAVRLNAPLVSDIVGFRVEGGKPVFVRQLFQGKFNADVSTSGDGAVFVSVQSGSFRGDAAAAGDSPAPVETVAVDLAAEAIRVKPGEPYQESAGGVDLIFICDVVHHIENRQPYYAKLAKALAPGGRLAIVDFYKRELPVGPGVQMKIAREAMIGELEQAGFRLADEHELLEYQYFLVFER